MALLTSAWGASSCAELRDRAERAINNFKSADSALTNFFEYSAGYLVFPNVRTSSLDLVGKQVRGIVYEKGKPVGEALLAETNIGRQENMNAFHEAIFFETAEALENFKQGKFVLNADISIVNAVEGAALTAKYAKGAAAFVVPKNGLLETITIGDQRFSYQPLN